MLVQHFSRRSVCFSKVLLNYCKCRFCSPYVTVATTQLLSESNISSKNRSLRSFSVISGDIPISITSGNMRLDMRRYQVVVAATRDMGIGKDGKLPWRLPSDLNFFKELTMTTSDPRKKNAIVMGRKTWESIPLKYRPLLGRLNVVLSRSGCSDITTTENVVRCQSIPSALEFLAKAPYCFSIEKVFVIGGGQILRETINAPGCDAIHITEIETSTECDTFIPNIDSSIFHPWHSSLSIVENNMQYSYVTYVRVKNSENGTLSKSTATKFEIKNFTFLPKLIFEKHEEFVYLKLAEEILSSGNLKDDSTWTGTLSEFGCRMRHNLRRYFPLLTTKRVFWRGVVEELLRFISSSTNAKVPQDKDVHIWDRNASRDYLDSIDLKDREEGYLRPIYGFQWRHFGARYMDKNADYTGQGFDQLADVIDKIRSRPDDRCIFPTAWDPSDLKLMAIPPCHTFAQFYVAKGELSCILYQQSADIGLGVPISIASYALLTCLVAHVCDLVPGDFIYVLGDAHLYRTHIEPLQMQLQRLPRPFPILRINPLKKDIVSFQGSDFELIGYDPHEKVDMKMSM